MSSSNLWLLMARLERRCRVRFEAVHAAGARDGLRWRLTIFNKDPGRSHSLVIEAKRARHAIVRGLAAACAAGWISSWDDGRAA